ncbi:sulfite exporter TauE/SafE family protein [Novosphingobium flavum]|uniref:Probable membrane transporter protein n=1 Tax=Novosphingobium aerophilum TaxID=2839843 RepID=A0A7X1KBL6_9SPHN|nr:sulfite exporter TauE/SafE family protein [Novosphingobium aerophilum]MBC2651333.1 sulfite exporter TauE/SafE family protein [Novosphingobium aerophilum]MBC2661201.1 sulfite exporter TauE/SafE family protein [Novosphingobium aerophilum]
MAVPMLLAALASGALIGLILGLVGGGGSILAVPLLVYVVGVGSPHVAIGTAAVAVTLNALASLVGHARAGRVKWRCAGVFLLAGTTGAALGAELGKAVDGQRLLALFGLLMIGVGLSLLRPRRTAEAPDVRLTLDSAARLLPRLVPIGLGVGLAAGFFGIGGGFLIVPGLIFATAMPMACAIGTSLVVVAGLGLTTAASYAAGGLVDWPVTAWLVLGGALGTVAGIRLGQVLGSRKGLLERGFAAIVIGVGVYVTVATA